MDCIRKGVGAIGIGFALAAPSAALAQGVLGGPDSAWYAGGSAGRSSSAICDFAFAHSCAGNGRPKGRPPCLAPRTT